MKISFRRSIVLAVATAGFALAGAGAASATTIYLPGTGVTKPCSATFDQSTDTRKIPPVHVTSSTTCSI